MGSDRDNYDDFEQEILKLRCINEPKSGKSDVKLPKKNGNSDDALKLDIKEIQILQRETILDIGKICTRLDTLTSAVQCMETRTEKIDKNVSELKDIVKELALNIYTR